MTLTISRWQGLNLSDLRHKTTAPPKGLALRCEIHGITPENTIENHGLMNVGKKQAILTHINTQQR